MLEVRLLGQFDVKLNSQSVVIPSRPAQSLLAYLILNAGTAYRREQLAGLLWPDTSDDNARSNLRHALWRIRKAIESKQTYLVTDDLSIRFDADSPYRLDVRAIERDLGEDASAESLIETLAQYHGELLPGFYDEWITLERERLQAIFERKMELLLDQLIAAQRWSETLDWSERWIGLGQSPEPAYRAMMQAHAASGNMAKVAATFERCAHALHDDLGVEPSDQTRTLYERLKAEQAKPTPQPSVLRKEESQKSNLPVPLTSFIGREREIDEVKHLLSATRLLTLTGAGGLGKTRLAIQAANELVASYQKGVWWISLVAITDPVLVPQAVAKTLDVREVSNQPLIETLIAYLNGQQVLIVLDNCEHLIDACAQLADQLLSACVNLKILATSREPLGLTGETILRVPSLSFPTLAQAMQLQSLNEFESIRLFVERASAVQPGLTLTPQNAFAVTQICSRLDGIPLAIELAAARTKVMSLSEIAARLDDRFNLLTQGSRTAMPRHQTLRAAIDWSHDLLGEPERILFRRLSVFAGSFDLETAEEVCSAEPLDKLDILSLVSQLADKSLIDIKTQTSPEYQATRYRLLETIRQYGLEKLIGQGEDTATHDRHLNFYIDLAEKAEPHIFGGDSVVWRNRLAMDFDNIRAALDWAASSKQPMAILRILSALVYYWFSHGSLVEWHQRVEDALASPEGRQRTSIRAKTLNGIGFIYWADMDPTDRRQQLEEALSIGQELDDKWNIATALFNLGYIAGERGAQAEARDRLEQSLAIWQAMGAQGQLEIGRTLAFLGEVAFNQGDTERARSLYEEAAAILMKLGDKNVLGHARRRLGQLDLRSGAYASAASRCKESLFLNHATDDPRGVLACISCFANIAAAQEKFDRAASLMAAVESLLIKLRLRLVQFDQREHERYFAVLQSHMDKDVFDVAWTNGAKMTYDQAIEFALSG